MDTTTTPTPYQHAVIGYMQRDAQGDIDTILCVECATQTTEPVYGREIAAEGEMCWDCNRPFFDAWLAVRTLAEAQYRWSEIHLGDMGLAFDEDLGDTAHARFAGPDGVTYLHLTRAVDMAPPLPEYVLTPDVAFSCDVVPFAGVWWVKGTAYIEAEVDPTVLAQARLVAADRNEGLDDDEWMPLRTAVEQARDVIFIPTPERTYVQGAWPFEDYGDLLSEAYRSMLTLPASVVATLPNTEVVVNR